MEGMGGEGVRRVIIIIGGELRGGDVRGGEGC